MWLRRREQRSAPKKETDTDGNIRGVVTYTPEDSEPVVLSDEVIGSGSVTVQPLGSFSFKRDTGAMEQNITSIAVAGGGEVFTITLVPSTGAHWVEDE